MKQILFIGITCLICMFTSCKDSGSTTGSDSNAAATKAFANNHIVYTALETGDVSKIDSVIAKDAVDHSGGMDGTKEVKGIDSIKAELAGMKKYFSDIHFDVIAEAMNGDYLFSLVKFTATCSPNNPMAGTKMDMTNVEVVKMKDGMFTDHWTYADPKEMMKMMGNMGGGAKMDDKMAHKDSMK